MKAALAARRPALLVPTLAGSQFVPPFMISGVAVALPVIGTDLGAGATSLGLVETLFLAGSVAMLLPAGRLADASDKATLYKLGLLAFGVTSLLVGLVFSMPLILLLRFLQGATSALIAVAAPALLADIVPPERRGRAYGGMIASIYAGLTLGPIAAGLLIDIWGWRAVFLAGGAALVAVYGVTQLVLKSAWRRPAPGSVHVPSTVLMTAAMLLIVLGTASLRVGPLGYGAIAAGLIVAVLFVLLQRRVEQPLLKVDVLMRNTVLHNALLVQCLLYTNAFCSVFLLSIYMQVTLGHSAKLSGQILAVGTVLMAAVAPLAGVLADRYRPGIIATNGVAVVIVAALMATWLDAESSLLHVALMLAVQGVGFALFSSPNMAIVMNSVPADRASIASALTAKSRSLGMLAGMAIAAALISLQLGNDPVDRDPQRFAEIMTDAFWILAGLTTAALAIGIAGNRHGGVPGRA
jgi:MFS family permease